jgi:hypothetical protein
MPDWKELIRERLGPGMSCSQDVVTELAGHLEEVYEEARLCESSEPEAMRLALKEVGNWHVLAEEIARTKSEEGPMNHRTKTVLLPAIAILFSAGLLLLFLDRAAILQRMIWTACMGLLLCTAALELNRLNPRTRTVWLPGLVSLTAASLFLFAEELVLMHDSSFYFTDLSLRPSHLISGLPFWFYLGWLLAQIFCGAMGAFLSRRGGGRPAARAVAGAFPAIVMFGLCAFVIPVSALLEHKAYVFDHPGLLALGILIWAGAPAVALLIGAAPFLRGTASTLLSTN